METEVVRRFDAVRSFRDPDCEVVQTPNRIFRHVREHAVERIDSLLTDPLIRGFRERGFLVEAEVLERTADGMVLGHPRIDFPSYPHEWPPSLLASAAELTLTLAEECLASGWGLKDATPYNVLFRGAKPVHVDWTSFERRQPGDTLWRAYGQFVQTFLLPLLLHRESGRTPREIFLESREGIPPEGAVRAIPVSRRLLGPGLRHATLPSWLAPWTGMGDYADRGGSCSAEKAQYVLGRLLAGLRRDVKSLRLRPAGSSWSAYMNGQAALSYSDAAFRSKAETVEAVLRREQARTVLDIGCNDGYFSFMAVRCGAERVVALDNDTGVLDELHRKAVDSGSPILPLHVNLARPTPPVGWCNLENPSLLDRLNGRFEMVLMLALVHHLAVTERAPLDRIVDLAADLTSRHVLVEFIDRSDPMFHALLRGRDSLFEHWTQDYFEEMFLRRFDCIEKSPIPASGRCLYLLRRR